MGVKLSNSDGYSSEINITPLVDVVLVLLIIFMVMVPVMMRGYDVSVPGEAQAAPPSDVERPEQLVLHIEREGCPVAVAGEGGCEVRINEDEVAVADLAAAVSERFIDRAGEDRVLFLAAESELNYEQVMRIVDISRSETVDLKIGVVFTE